MTDTPLRLRNLFTLGPTGPEPYVALRCGLGVFMPLLILIGFERFDLAIFAVFAAFTNIYGRAPGHIDRLLAQIKVAGVYWVLMLAGWLSARHLIDFATAEGPWVLVALTGLVSGITAAWAGFLRIRPAGSLFQIFCFAAIASSPITAPLSDGMFVASATIGFALLLGQAGRLLPRFRAPASVTPFIPLDAVERRHVWLSTAMHVIAVVAAGTVANTITPFLDAGHRNWAMVSAVVPLVGHSTRHRVERGIHRILGNVVGLTVLALLLVWWPPIWVVVLLLGLATFGAELFMNSNYFFAQVFMTPLALLTTTLDQPVTAGLLYDRIIETVIGASVGMAAVLLLAWGQRRLAQRRGARPHPAQ